MDNALGEDHAANLADGTKASASVFADDAKTHVEELADRATVAAHLWPSSSSRAALVEERLPRRRPTSVGGAGRCGVNQNCRINRRVACGDYYFNTRQAGGFHAPASISICDKHSGQI
jgi:hypothetical protein